MVLEYSRLYPQDQVVVVGEAAVHLHLKLHRMSLPDSETTSKKIELNITSSLTWRAVLRRWTDLLPKSYQAYKTNQIDGSFTLRSTKETNVFRVLVNGERFQPVDLVKINGLKVMSLERLKTDYLQGLVRDRQDLEMARRNFIVLDEEDTLSLTKRCEYFSDYLQLLCQVPLE